MRRIALVSLRCLPIACNDPAFLQPDVADPPAPSFAPGKADHGPIVARATGSGHYRQGPDNLLRTFSFTARRYRDGFVTGQYQFHNRRRDVMSHGRVTCLSIDGNRAWVGAEVDRVATGGTTAIEPEQFRGWLAIDNGEGARALPDQLSAFFLFDPEHPVFPAESCEDRPDWPAPALEAGNIQVKQK